MLVMIVGIQLFESHFFIVVTFFFFYRKQNCSCRIWCENSTGMNISFSFLCCFEGKEISGSLKHEYIIFFFHTSIWLFSDLCSSSSYFRNVTNGLYPLIWIASRRQHFFHPTLLTVSCNRGDNSISVSYFFLIFSNCFKHSRRANRMQFKRELTDDVSTYGTNCGVLQKPTLKHLFLALA